jgi:kynureninase
MNSLTVNLHLMFVPFYAPSQTRFKIIMEAKVVASGDIQLQFLCINHLTLFLNQAFPSDRYLVESQVRFHGFDPEQSIVLLEPRTGEYCLRDEDILAAIENEGDSTALVFLPGVHYYTGQAFDIHAITAAAHKKARIAIFPLHSLFYQACMISPPYCALLRVTRRRRRRRRRAVGPASIWRTRWAT